jgi:hypothetical protein
MSTITEAIEAVEKAMGDRAKHLQKLEKRLAAARRDLAKNKRPTAILNTLIEELRNMPAEPPGPDLRHLVGILTQYKESAYVGQLVGLPSVAPAGGRGRPAATPCPMRRCETDTPGPTGSPSQAPTTYPT